MQNSNLFQQNSFVPFPFCLDERLARAYARAREKCGGADPGASDIFAAYSAELRGSATPRPAERADDRCDPHATDGRLEFAELLVVLREPIEWLFTLAERGAAGDPVDIAAIHRVRDAVRARLSAAISCAATRASQPRIRTTDLLTVAGLLIGTLDPAILRRAAHNVGDGIADAVAAILQLDPSLASCVASAAASFLGGRGAQPAAPPWYGAPSHLGL